MVKTTNLFSTVQIALHYLCHASNYIYYFLQYDMSKRRWQLAVTDTCMQGHWLTIEPSLEANSSSHCAVGCPLWEFSSHLSQERLEHAGQLWSHSGSSFLSHSSRLVSHKPLQLTEKTEDSNPPGIDTNAANHQETSSSFMFSCRALLDSSCSLHLRQYPASLTGTSSQSM